MLRPKGKPKKKVEEVSEDVEEDEEELVEEEDVSPPVQTNSNDVWTVQDIATETTSVLYNSKTKERVDVLGALVKILNKLEEY